MAAGRVMVARPALVAESAGMEMELSSIRIRRAVVGDAAVMPDLEQSAGELFRTLPDLASLADGDNQDVSRYRALVDGGWCWVAEDDDGSCGFVAAEVVEGELHICELAVAIDRQRRGIGAMLMQAAIAAADAGSLDAVTLTTFRDVAWNAPIYQRMGFDIVPNDARGARLDAIIAREGEMGLPLDRRCAMRLRLDRQGSR